MGPEQERNHDQNPTALFHIVASRKYLDAGRGERLFQQTYRGGNMKWSAPYAFTGLPAHSMGFNTHNRADASADSRNRTGPKTAFASITIPASEITTAMVTSPEIPAAFASGGYAG